MHVFERGIGGAGDYNVGHVARAAGDQPVVLIEWAVRERGLMVPPGNPGGIRGIADLAGKRVMPRQAEAGSQLLLLDLLDREGIQPSGIEFLDPPARNETDLALAVADSKADAALGLAGLARRFRLDFVPLVRERYDLLIWRRFYFEEPFQRFLAFCRGQPLSARAAELGGYDLAGLGTVRFNGS
jgi:molybdate-binding protein